MSVTNENLVGCSICVCRLSNTHPSVIQGGTTAMRRCETPPTSLLPAKCSGVQTALRTNTSTPLATAERRLSTRTAAETGMEVRKIPATDYSCSHRTTITTASDRKQEFGKSITKITFSLR